MGMSIASSSFAGVSQSSAISNWQQKQQDFKALTSALQSGDLKAAQTAYAALTAGQTSSSNAANSNSPLAKIGQALKNGDLAGAQKAAQEMQGKHHHHHHGGQSVPVAAPTAPSTTTSSTVGDRKSVV
jgi:hypothetical protein